MGPGRGGPAVGHANLAYILAAMGKTALLLVWDNAGWHISKAVRSWLRCVRLRAVETLAWRMRFLADLIRGTASSGCWSSGTGVGRRQSRPLESRRIHGARRRAANTIHATL